ncbi:phospholipase D-like domain-containing protein (plasmid) [Streptomyces sp. NBC_01724]|uniref:phospholipase D family protein n=1 Tax=Streptomyces sp. NBC_01724 TaxID=2975922 RepID=UPI002E376E25|nr:phospholipase D-like domain-containing protein [Streptomyces sp. NBC_01724]
MLTSALFTGDPLLEAIAQDQDRISQTRHRTDPAVRKVQTALLGWDPDCLPRFGADSDYGDETAGAVARFKVEVLGVPPPEVINDVGPLTVLKLDEMQADAERPPAESVAPEDWLLTEAEIGPFRSPAFTLDNLVLFFVDAEGYYSTLASQLDGLAAGDRVLFAGWRFSPEQLLHPGVAGSPGILDRLLKLHADGIVVRALLYGSHFSTLPVRRPRVPTLPSKDNFDFRTGLVDAGAQAILDARVGEFGSHHQKCAVVQGATEGPCAFVGGIDVCLDRWDNGAHVDPPIRQREPDFLGQKISLPGWHDVQCAVFGPTVGQIWQSMVQRWNDPTRPSRIDATPAPIPSSEAPGPPMRSGTQAVQVLRTLTCKGVYSFLPGGEFTVSAAYRKAIRRARHYIYIEDQYLWPSPVVDDLRDAAARGVQVILVTARDFDAPGLKDVHMALRTEALQRIASVAPANVHCFHLEQAATSQQIYVHAKLMIVDDQYAAAGSANLNFRSHTTDSELQLGVFDTELADGTMGGAPHRVGRSVRELRTQIWGEHLNEDPSLHEDPLAGLGRMPAAGGKTGHLVNFPVPPQVPGVDWREVLRELLRTVQHMENWQLLAPVVLGPLSLPVTLVPGMDLGLLADLIPDPESFLRRLLNPHTVC